MPPIDPSILMGYRSPQIQQHDPIEQYSKSIALKGLLQQQQLQERATQEGAQVRQIMQESGGDPNATVQALMRAGTPTALKTVDALMGVQKHRADLRTADMTAAQSEREAAVFSPANIAANTVPARPAGPSPDPQENAQAADYGTPPVAQRPATPASVNYDALRAQSMMTSPRAFEAGSAHIAAEGLRRATQEGTAQARRDALEARLYDIDRRSEDKALSREAATALQTQRLDAQRELRTLVGSLRQEPAPHFTNTVADDGTVRVHAFGRDGNLIRTTEPGGKAPSVLSNENVRERQLAGALTTTIKPHRDALDAYQRYGEIRTTGDNAQANQFLAQQLMQMSKTGQRVIPKAELERILGSGELGNDWIGRGANMISQMAAGVRTPAIDKRMNDLADAMAKASADRIGQEIQNTVARTPAGVDPARVVGAKPTIYGRFVISPSGKVHTFASPQEAQEKLRAAAEVVGQ